MSKSKTILAIFVLLITTLACNALAPTAEPIPTTIIEPVFTPAAGKIPLTEAEVPRVTLEEARVAIESGAAIVVDVRSKPAYDASHIASAIYIPLADIENNSAGLGLDKEQWIITYCT